jgi:hypothetical protein
MVLGPPCRRAAIETLRKSCVFRVCSLFLCRRTATRSCLGKAGIRPLDAVLSCAMPGPRECRVPFVSGDCVVDQTERRCLQGAADPVASIVPDLLLLPGATTSSAGNDCWRRLGPVNLSRIRRWRALSMRRERRQRHGLAIYTYRRPQGAPLYGMAVENATANSSELSAQLHAIFLNECRVTKPYPQVSQVQR